MLRSGFCELLGMLQLLPGYLAPETCVVARDSKQVWVLPQVGNLQGRCLFNLISLSVRAVVQYDVELIQHIEDLIGHQLLEHEMNESEVLKDITRVYAAKRAAHLRAAEDERKEGGRQELLKHKLVRKKKKTTEI